MNSGVIVLICVLTILIVLPLIALLYWIVIRKGRCKRIHYSHNITTESQSGEILAVVSTSNRAEAVTNPKPARTPSIQSRSQESDAGPFWGRRWTRQWAYASYPHPSYHTHNQEQFRQQQQQQNWSRILIPSISDGMERRNEVLTHQRIFGQGRGDWVRPLPSYSGLGGLGPPPTYQDALALQRLRNSVR